MRERRGAVGRATGIMEGVAAAARRRAREREPRVVLYDERGFPRLVQPAARGYERVLELCERMVATVGEGPPEPPEEGSRPVGEGAA